MKQNQHKRQPPARGRRSWTGAAALLAMLPALGLAPGDPSGEPHRCGLLVGVGTTFALYHDATYGCMDVAGTLRIAAGATLTLDGDPCSASTVDGTVFLEGSGSVLAIKDDDHAIGGSGKIIGEHNSAAICEQPGQSRTLTIDTNLTVQGCLKVKMNSFVNNGTVLANDSTTNATRDTFELYSGTPSGSGAWQAVRVYGSNDACLKFSESATGLTGAFTVSGSSMLFVEVEVDVCTTGDLTFTGGKILVAAGGSFKAGGSCP